MKVLHTSDWHLGAKLNEYQRFDEHQFFLDQLLTIIQHEQIELLLISGDVFDNSSPSNQAQALYFNFLNKLCKHHVKVVVTAGNHDSAALLEAPRNLLKDQLDIIIVGKITADQPDNQLFYFNNKERQVALAVGAVPYIREQDLKISYASSNYDLRQHELSNAVIKYYNQIVQSKLNRCPTVPLILMGHLTAKGNIFTSDELLGGLGVVDLSLIDKNYQFFALGHIHSYQGVPGVKNCYYSGSPLSISFSEHKEKKVIIYDSIAGSITPYALESMKKLVELTGEVNDIIASINKLKAENYTFLVKINYQAAHYHDDIKLQLVQLVEKSNVTIITQSCQLLYTQSLLSNQPNERLATLNELQVFERLLKQEKLDEDETAELTILYQKVIDQIDQTVLDE